MMQFVADFLRSVTTSETAVLAVIFVIASALALIVIFAIVPMLETRRRLRTISSDPSRPSATPLDGVEDNISRELQVFYESFLAGDKHSLKTRLIQAGYFSPNAIYAYNLIRLVASVTVFAAAYLALDRMTRDSSALQVFVMSAFAGLLGVIVPNFVLDYMARSRRDQYRRSFPDFVDMLVVCCDAGLSIEAASQRVSREYLGRDRAFGIHLGVMMLEVRAGKRLRDALHSLADRTGLEEAKTLATLFRQSEELGVSLTRALRTHSTEMRQIRMLRAEEKANVLPVKMLMPLGAFVFPTTLIIVLLPVMMKLLEALKGMTPPSL